MLKDAKDELVLDEGQGVVETSMNILGVGSRTFGGNIQ
jgi:hypothetical protein